MITAERLTSFLMKHIVRIALILMVAGMVFAALELSTLPDSILFFNIAAVLFLFTPLIISFCTGVFFIVSKQFKMALVSFLLFAILSTSVGVYFFIIK